jgi:hypothetical protein
LHTPPGVIHQVTSPGAPYADDLQPCSTDGIFAAVHKLTQEQIMEAELTKKIALEHDTVLVEEGSDGRSNGTVLG